MTLYESPKTLVEGTSEVLCVFNLHPPERGMQQYRELYVQDPPEGTAIIDGNVEAARLGQRCTDGARTYGNLNLQFGATPHVEGERGFADAVQLDVLRRTRARAMTILEAAAEYTDVVDIHGSGDLYGPLVWMGKRPTAGALALAYAFSPEVAVLSPPHNLLGRLGRGVGPEIPDDDWDSVYALHGLVQRLGRNELRTPTIRELQSMHWLECIGALVSVDDGLRTQFGLKESYRSMEELPGGVGDYFGVNGATYCLSWDSSTRSMEVVTEVGIDSLTLPSGIGSELANR